MRADRAVDVRRVAQHEAAAVTKALGAPVMDAIGGEPGALLEGQRVSGFLAHRGDHFVERQVALSAQRRRDDSNDSPVIRPAHREDQVEPVGP